MGKFKTLFGGVDVPDPPAPPPPPPPPPQAATPAESQESSRARADERRRRRAAFGAHSTILTGPSGVAGGAPTTSKTLLGQ